MFYLIHKIANRVFRKDRELDPGMSTLETIWKGQIAWGQISFLLGVLGNIFTLYATTAHNAIKLDKMSIWIIKNLAVADICNCFLVVLPILLYQYYGNITQLRMFGFTFCKIFACYRYLFFMANIFLVNILSLNKLLRCLFPLRNLATTKRQKVTVTMATVIVSILPVIWMTYGVKDGFALVSFDPEYFGASYLGFADFDDMTDIQFAGQWIFLIIFNCLPCLTLIILNTTLVVVALVKAKSTVNRTNIFMVVLVTVGFLLSSLPHFVDLVLENKTSDKDSDDEIFKEIAWCSTYFSTWINPFIYLAVNPSFRQFTSEKMSLLVQRLSVRR